VLTNEHMTRLVEYINTAFSIDFDAERTLEGNPDDLIDSNKIKHALNLGFNRFSLGVQSLQNEVTEFIGRGHDRDMTIAAIIELKKTGKPFNVDMIYGLAHQTPQSFANDIQTLLDLGVPTITMYRLRNNDRKTLKIGGTSHNNKYKLSNLLEYPTLESTHEMRELATTHLITAKYSPSPACFWSAPNTYPNGNMPRGYINKWRNYDTHIAVGPGVYGWLSNPQEQSILQYHHIHLRKEYGETILQKKTSNVTRISYSRTPCRCLCIGIFIQILSTYFI